MVREKTKYSYSSTYDLENAYHQIAIVDEDMSYTAFEVDGAIWKFTLLPMVSHRSNV